MKKAISVFLAVFYLAVTISVNAFATDEAKISARFKNNLNGLSYAECEEFADISSGNLVFRKDGSECRTILCDCTGDLYFGKIKSGRTYYIYYEFDAAEGYSLPDELAEKNVSFECERGTQILWYHYVDTTDNEKCLYVCEKLNASGNIFQIVFGKLADVFLKIKAWSPY